MTGATTVPRDVEEYLAAVRESLADLPAAERDDLLAEVEASLADAAADTGRPVAATLGAAEDFAAELRAAAGLQAPPPTPRAKADLGRRVRAFLRRGVAPLRSLATELAPIWWFARGYVAVGALAYALDSEWSTRFAGLPLLGSPQLGAAAVALAVVVSVFVGAWTRRHGSPLPRLALAVNVALAFAAVPVALAVTDTSAYDALVERAYAPSPTPVVPQTGLRYDGEPVRNVYPFSREGRLLHDVLLYDHRGRPLNIASSRALDPNRRFVVTNGNRELFNVFPIRYFEPRTRRVARPNAAPRIELPLIRTPPLRARSK
jgi:hypothetical protein